MVNSGPERGQTVLLQPAENLGAERPLARRPAPKPPSALPLAAAVMLGLLWLGGVAAFLWGYYGPTGLAGVTSPLLAGWAVAALLPPALFIAVAWALIRGQALGQTAQALAEVTDRLFTADETAARTAARLGRAVRRELDALNTGLDGAVNRLRALETALQTQISAIDEAGARVQTHSERAGAQLAEQRERLEATAAALSETASKAGVQVAGSAAQVHDLMQNAGATLSAAGAALDEKATQFRGAAQAAAEAPHAAAGELDRQARRIEAVSEAAVARAEFVLGRHERHRAAMGELLNRLKQEGDSFEAGIAGQRKAMEEAVALLQAEAESFAESAASAHGNIDQLMEAAATRAGQLTASYGREAEKLRETSETASAALARMIAALQEAGGSASALIAETTGEAKNHAKTLVGEAMGECHRLVQVSASLASQTDLMRRALAEAVAEVESHLLTLPGLAQQEAARVRDMVKSETEELLDLSARTLSTIHARNAQRGVQRPVSASEPAAPTVSEEKGDGFRSFAGKLSMRPRRKDEGKWEISQLLAAAESGERPRELKPNAAAALGALQLALADLALDLDVIHADGGPSGEDWKRYLAGDRTFFVRRLGSAIDTASVEHITALYQGNARFREAANVYLGEFETMLAKAQEGDGAGLLASSLLTADTGKIYLALAYALGRLS